MAQLGRSSKICTIVLLLALAVNVFAEQQSSPAGHGSTTPFITIPDKRVFGYGIFVDFHIRFGIGYVANISTDMTRMEQMFSLHVPIGFGVDTRFIAWCSIFAGLDFLYEAQSFLQNRDDDASVRHYYHNLQLDVPIIAKFYPFVDKGAQYENMFFGTGLVAHFSPARFYQIKEDGEITQGSVFDSQNDFVIPLSALPPVNVGLRLSMGNTFMVKDKAGFGMELYVLYLFIPIVNGYWSEPQYIVRDNPYLDFSLTVGISFSVAIRGYSSLRD